jgi:cob(I)alamin adenosyltransferase
MSITTRTGDDGTTRLFSGERVPKTDARLEALGDLDELVSALGVARTQALPDDLRDALLTTQRELFELGAELASTQPARLDADFLTRLEKRRDELEARTPHPEGFILPGETTAGAQIDVARSIARRLERRVAALAGDGRPGNPTHGIWLNRLSDYLWLLARAAEKTSRPLKGP